MGEIRALLVNRSSTTSSYSRRSRLSDIPTTLSPAQVLRYRMLFVVPCNKTIMLTATLYTNTDSQEQARAQEHRHRQNQATFVQAQERQCLRQQQEEERAHQHQDAQGAEARRQEQQLR